MKILLGSSAFGYELVYDDSSGELIVRDERVPGLAPAYFPLAPALAALARHRAVDFASWAVLTDPSSVSTPVEKRQAVPPPPKVPGKRR